MEPPLATRTDAEIQRFIESNSLVWRFCMYGAIKNLQFFEAYLLLILMEWGYSLFQIGVLQSIMFALTYAFEVPSGVIADHFGKKNELLLCFVFYIISFVFYAFGDTGFGVLVLASVFYGLGEAFRSGTHKAMIMAWLDRHELGKFKTFIYSRTRSFSNLGSALNAVLSIAIIVLLDSYRLVFAISVLPFVADFLMVATYPSYMNETPERKQSFRAIVRDTRGAMADVLLRAAPTRNTLLASSTFMAVFTTLKHYIQPIMVQRSDSMLAAWGVPAERRPLGTKVAIGVLYAIFYLCSAAGTRHSHRLKACFRSDKMAMDVLFTALLAIVLAIGACIAAGATAAVLPLYLLLFFVQNLWKPWSVAAVSDLMGKKRRALVLSVDSLLQTTLQFCLAPAVGYLADAASIEAVFFVLGGTFLLLNTAVLGGGWGPARAPVADAAAGRAADGAVWLAEQHRLEGRASGTRAKAESDQVELIRAVEAEEADGAGHEPAPQPSTVL